MFSSALQLFENLCDEQPVNTEKSSLKTKGHTQGMKINYYSVLI